MDEHGPDLGDLIHPAIEPFQAGSRPSAGTGRIVDGGQIPGAEANQGIRRIEAGGHQFPDFPGRDLPSGGGVHHLKEHFHIEQVIPVLFQALMADQAHIARTISLADLQPHPGSSSERRDSASISAPTTATFKSRSF